MNAIAIADNDVALIAWNAAQPIDDCLGFAVYRIDLSSGQTTPLDSWIGFKGQTNSDWKPRSTETCPPSGSSSRLMRRKMVVLPEPFGPTSPTFSPRLIDADASRKRIWWPCCLLMESRRITGLGAS